MDRHAAAACEGVWARLARAVRLAWRDLLKARRPPACPHCRGLMVRRRAYRGERPGVESWDCARVPACRGIR